MKIKTRDSNLNGERKREKKKLKQKEKAKIKDGKAQTREWSTQSSKI